MGPSAEVMLNLQKEFKVPVERLFEAWTQEDDLKQWWHPMGNQLVKVVNNIKEGGEIRYEFKNDGNELPIVIDGVYKEVKRHERLVYTWNWNIADEGIRNSEFLLRIEFLSQGNGSLLKVLQENFIDEEAVHPHREGWEKALEELKVYLERN